jgi:hypothetical protein
MRYTIGSAVAKFQKKSTILPAGVGFTIYSPSSYQTIRPSKNQDTHISVQQDSIHCILRAEVLQRQSIA